jgi:hypothetical protein
MTDEVFMDANAAHQTSMNVIAGNTQSILTSLVAEAIAEEVQDGLFTASISMSGQASQDVQYVCHLLNNLQYQASVTGTNLVVNW